MDPDRVAISLSFVLILFGVEKRYFFCYCFISFQRVRQQCVQKWILIILLFRFWIARPFAFLQEVEGIGVCIQKISCNLAYNLFSQSLIKTAKYPNNINNCDIPLYLLKQLDSWALKKDLWQLKKEIKLQFTKQPLGTWPLFKFFKDLKGSLFCALNKSLENLLFDYVETVFDEVCRKSCGICWIFDVIPWISKVSMPPIYRPTLFPWITHHPNNRSTTPQKEPKLSSTIFLGISYSSYSSLAFEDGDYKVKLARSFTSLRSELWQPQEDPGTHTASPNILTFKFAISSILCLYLCFQ